MARAESRAAQVDRAVIDLAEAVMLQGREGDVFGAVVTDVDERGAKVQLCTEIVVTRLPVDGLDLGQEVELELVEDIPARRLAALRARLALDPDSTRLLARRTAAARRSRRATTSGALERCPVLRPGKASCAHPCPGRAGIDDMDPELAGKGGLVGISAEQGLERRLGRAIERPRRRAAPLRPRR